MARSFDELRAKMDPERRRRNDARVEQEVGLYDLRAALDYTQKDIAGKIGTHQSNISKIENRSDLLVSTLRRYLGAIGARLVIKAVFDDREVDLSQIYDVDSSSDDQEHSEDVASA